MQAIDSLKTAITATPAPSIEELESRVKQAFLSYRQTQNDEASIQTLAQEIALLPLDKEAKLKVSTLFMDIFYPQSSPGFSKKISHFFKNIYRVPIIFFTTVYDAVFDGNEVWKLQKYHWNLENIQTALQRDRRLVEEFKGALHSLYPASELDEYALQLLDLLANSSEKPLQEQRQLYRQFVSLLRTALQSPTYLAQKSALNVEWSKAALVVQKLCEYRFTSVHLYSFCETLVEMMIKEGMTELVKQQPGNQRYTLLNPLEIPFETQFEAIHAAPQSHKGAYLGLWKNVLSGATGFYYDPHWGSNMPYATYSFQLKQKDIQVIRIGTPTIQHTHPSRPVINPEFEAFAMKNNVLYISLQDNHEHYLGDESQRNQALTELHRKYPENFSFCVFSNDSAFYHQTDPFAELENVLSFKEQFLKILSQNAYYFPEQFLVSEWLFNTLLHETLEDLYGIDPANTDRALTKSERRICIEIFHVKLALTLLKKSQANKFLLVCKDGKDRAGKDNALFYLYLNLLAEGKLSDEAIKTMQVYLHAVSLIVKKNTMNFRRKRFLEAYQHLLNPEVQKRIALRQAEAEIKGIHIVKIEKQKVL